MSEPQSITVIWLSKEDTTHYHPDKEQWETLDEEPVEFITVNSVKHYKKPIGWH